MGLRSANNRPQNAHQMPVVAALTTTCRTRSSCCGEMGPRKGDDDLPDYVMAQAQGQAEHVMALLKQSEDNEAVRASRTASCPRERQKVMNAQFERKRAKEVLKIQRLREEHAFFLSQSMQFGPEGGRGARRAANAFVPNTAGVPGLYADKPRPDCPGTTARELGFLKQAYSKLDATGPNAKERQLDAMRAKQAAQASRLTASSPAAHGGFSCVVLRGARS